MKFLSLGFSFKDLFLVERLERLDQTFLNDLQKADEGLALRLGKARTLPLPSLEESALLLDLAPYVEDFMGRLFCVEKELSDLQSEAYALAPLYRCKRLFVQRQAAKAFSKEDTQKFVGSSLKEELVRHMGKSYTDLTFAKCVLQALENEVENKLFLDIAKKYAAWALHQDQPSILFKLPKKISREDMNFLKRKGETLTSPRPFYRKGFDCLDLKITTEAALDQAHYCILCHNQGKDSCSKGISEKTKGCPLGQKISEMNALRSQGYVLGALAVIMVDNPMVAATGRRICNDCKKACIFQKQEPVDIPSVETQILDSILNLPWGVEIYGLLSRWNPLNLKQPFPKKHSGYKVLVAGMGPAGFTLAHYLLNEGHTVVGVDGLKIEPLEKNLLTKPIREWENLKQPLSQRPPAGFGGVAEYGITVRWEKNYLMLIRLLLERRSHFVLYDGVRLGGTLTLPQVFSFGFDHVALCLGAGRLKVLDFPQGLPRGLRMASDFLMTLHLSGAMQKDSFTNLQIRLPIVVVGGGLTAVDTATEALAYYPVQVEKFLNRTERLGSLPPSLSIEEKEIAEEFLSHAQAFRRDDRRLLEGACRIVYRKAIQDSPSYRLNQEELELALHQGVHFLENATPHELKLDSYGHIEGLVIKTKTGFEDLSCRTLLIAAGTQPNTLLEEEDSDLKIGGENVLISYQGNEKVSFFGDLNPAYHGNVVKAMASAKEGYSHLCDVLSREKPQGVSRFFEQLETLLCPRIQAVSRLTPTIVEIVVKAPQAVLNFKPGQFFRLQNYGLPGMEGLALTGACADLEQGLLSLIVLEMGGSSQLCQFLKPGERVALMGPTGMPTEIPTNENVLLIGGGLGNAVLFSIGRALKEKGNSVLYLAGYKTPMDRFKAEEIEAISDHVIWCSESSPGFAPSRPQDFSYVGNVIDGLLSYMADSPPLPLHKIHRILTIGSDRMMAAVSCARRTVLKSYLNPEHKAIMSLNSPMQCMMKEICGQCIQMIMDPVTQKSRVIFACAAQDQGLDEVDFDILHSRLKQNSLLEKQTHLWMEKYLNEVRPP